LQWKHGSPIRDEKTGKIIAAKLIAYPDEFEQYYTFIIPEAYNALKDRMDYRASHGEEITDKSPLMRNMWRTVDVKRGANCGRVGLATKPKKLAFEGLKKVVNRALWDQGLRNILSEGQRRMSSNKTMAFASFSRLVQNRL